MIGTEFALPIFSLALSFGGDAVKVDDLTVH
ncbi:hypothetical protein K239x_48230 [Planctomycetes bacterium K23_9]|uniref:Uncharacterized protein n=1 Tax=Stieleria marina TaxID=1930275 RepID=A0A517P0B4_9BACT|nr:hypothetical protein K239x_48230 [Planctomycetes bacterium K23_9]